MLEPYVTDEYLITHLGLAVFRVKQEVVIAGHTPLVTWQWLTASTPVVGSKLV